MLKAYWQLQPPIRLVRVTTIGHRLEKTYEDRNGHRAIIIRPATFYEQVKQAKGARA